MYASHLMAVGLSGKKLIYTVEVKQIAISETLV